MTQSSCRRDTKRKSHPCMKLASVRVFSCKHPLKLSTYSKTTTKRGDHIKPKRQIISEARKGCGKRVN